MRQSVFNERLRQVIILGIILFLAISLIKQLNIFIPGILGAVTLYILARNLYFRWVFKNKWKPGLSALLWMLIFLVIVSLPIYLSIEMVSPKISQIVANPQKIIGNIQTVSTKVNETVGMDLIKPNAMQEMAAKITGLLPKLLNSTGTVITNLAMMFFLFYYMLLHGRKMERSLGKIIPLKPQNINSLASETRMMVRANALGIPIISIIQGLVATLGYWIFGVQDWGMWGFVTGVFAFFPIVGTMIVWVPLAIVMFASGENTALAIGFVAYNVIVTGNVDYLARMSLMKRMGDVHPVVTVLGVIIGLNMFGFIGLVFGPLLISYILLLIKIYMNEFAEPGSVPEEFKTNEEKILDESRKAQESIDDAQTNLDEIQDTASKQEDKDSGSK